MERLELEAKEGLALLTGTTVMTGVAAIVVDEAALSVSPGARGDGHGRGSFRLVARLLSSGHSHGEASSGTTRGGRDVQLAAVRFASWRCSWTRYGIGWKRRAGRSANSTRRWRPRNRSRAPYSLRCSPQGLGPMLETLEEVRTVIEREGQFGKRQSADRSRFRSRVSYVAIFTARTSPGLWTAANSIWPTWRTGCTP